MAARFFPYSSSTRRAKQSQSILKNIHKPSRSQIKLLNIISNKDINEKSISSKSPIFKKPSYYNNDSHNHLPSSSPRIISKVSSCKRRNKSLKLSKNIQFGFNVLKKPENLRYLDNTFEESYKNFNAVSTPPEEEFRSLTPVCDNIDKDINLYINQWPRHVPRLRLPNSSVLTVKSELKKSKSVPQKKIQSKFSLKSVKITEKHEKSPTLPSNRVNPGSIRLRKGRF